MFHWRLHNSFSFINQCYFYRCFRYGRALQQHIYCYSTYGTAVAMLQRTYKYTVAKQVAAVYRYAAAHAWRSCSCATAHPYVRRGTKAPEYHGCVDVVIRRRWC